MAADSLQAPHFHSVDQMLEAVKAGLRASQLAHLSCTEPMLISLEVTTPAGKRARLATASAQPVGKKRKRPPDGIGGHRACHLFKHEQAGVVPT